MNALRDISAWLRSAVWACALLSSPSAFAQEGLRTASSPFEVTGLPAIDVDRFGQFEESFLLFHRLQNRGWAGADEAALRARYSFKYSMCGVREGRIAAPSAQRSGNAGISNTSLCRLLHLPPQAELFLAYTGEFDYYMGTRPSGPVLNRLSAPGLYVRWPLRPSRDLEFGLVHRSNGQVGDTLSPRGREFAAAAYAAGDHRFFDSVSRGADFLSVGLQERRLLDNQALDLQARGRIYLGAEESAVTWGPLANTGRRFADYDRLDLRLRYHLAQAHRFELLWRVGDKGLATDSFTLGWRARWFDLPFYLRLHSGPMNTLSNYTQRQDSVGLGLLFETY